MNISIGAQIRYLRKLSNLTQEELAERLGTTKSAVGMWETDKRNPNTHMLHNIAEFFNKDISYFIRFEHEDNIFAVENVKNDNSVTKAVDEFSKSGSSNLELNDFISSIELSENIGKHLSIDGEVLSEAELNVFVKQLKCAADTIRIIRNE